MNPTLAQIDAAAHSDRSPQTNPAARTSVLTVSSSVVAELTVGCSMVVAMLAYVIFSSGMLNQVI